MKARRQVTKPLTRNDVARTADAADAWAAKLMDPSYVFDELAAKRLANDLRALIRTARIIAGMTPEGR